MFHEFFELSPVDYAKMLINTKNPNESKESVAEIKQKIKDRIKKMSEREKKKKKKKKKKKMRKRKKKKSADEILKIIEEILDYNKNAQKIFWFHQKLIKKNQNQNLKKALQK